MLHHTAYNPGPANRFALHSTLGQFDGPLEMLGTPMRFARNEEIYGDGEPVEYIYKVLSGAVRTSKILSDGRRQIGSFYLPGDLFGLEAGNDHTFSAEAVAECRILMIKLRSARELAARDPNVASLLWTATSFEMERAHAHMLLLIKTAQERVAGFLLDMLKRSKNTSTLHLPMSRREIADYLGLTIETVSRNFSMFERSHSISLRSSRQVEIHNRSELKRMAA